MITMVVPTRNRAHTLRLVMPSYYEQDLVSEIVFVSDAGSDDSETIIRQCGNRYPHVVTHFVRNTERYGASYSRNVGVERAGNDFILFCDDDEYLEMGYASTCLKKLLASNAGAVSGRRVYLREGETQEQALHRFGLGIRPGRPFRALICEYVNAARFDGDIHLPVTNAIILTPKHLLQQLPYDHFYARGNGYREESDYQMNLFVHGYDIIVTNDCHSIHLPMSQVRGGGQRTRPWERIYWSIYYTRYFFGKYYAKYARRVGMIWPEWVALGVFALFAVYRETLRPPLYKVAYWWMMRRERLGKIPATASGGLP
jgi:glycosyltransferase involved in cell wall biosynthesis